MLYTVSYMGIIIPEKFNLLGFETLVYFINRNSSYNRIVFPDKYRAIIKPDELTISVWPRSGEGG